jgi:hypothetical protein
MDMAVEYRKAFGPMEPGMTWHEVLAHVQRVRGLELRERLIIADAQITPPAVNTDGVSAGIRAKYERAAYPEKRR